MIAVFILAVNIKGKKLFQKHLLKFKDLKEQICFLSWIWTYVRHVQRQVVLDNGYSRSVWTASPFSYFICMQVHSRLEFQIPNSKKLHNKYITHTWFQCLYELMIASNRVLCYCLSISFNSCSNFQLFSVPSFGYQNFSIKR